MRTRSARTPWYSTVGITEVVEGSVSHIPGRFRSGFTPIVACLGDHPGSCPIDDEIATNSAGHELVVRIDYDDRAHRTVLRLLRRASSGGIRALPQVGTTFGTGRLW